MWIHTRIMERYLYFNLLICFYLANVDFTNKHWHCCGLPKRITGRSKICKFTCFIPAKLSEISWKASRASKFYTGCTDGIPYWIILMILLSLTQTVVVICIQDNTRQYLLMALTYLVHISKVHEIEVFKICLEYWNFLAADLFNET